MNVTKRFFVCMVLAVAALGFANIARAAYITFDLDPFTGDPADAIVTVDDETSGLFRVNVSVIPEASTGNIGDITGVFFNLSPSVASDNITSIIGGPIIGFENNTNDLGNGVNLTGGGADNPGLFDVGLKYEGFNVDDVQEVEFTIDRTDADLLGLALADFTGFGLRLQTVGVPGTGRGGSSKLSGFDDDSGSEMPEPASMAMLGMGLLGLAGFKRRKK